VIATVHSELAARPGYNLITTGHSLGGTIASLSKISLLQNFPGSYVSPMIYFIEFPFQESVDSSVRMFTYGQPRTGNAAYAAFVNDNFGPNVFRGTIISLEIHIPLLNKRLVPFLC